MSNTNGIFKYASQNNFDKYNGVGSQLSIISPISISPAISGWSNVNDVSGTSVTNGINYNVYAFKPTISPAATPGTYSYTLTYSSTVSTYIYVHAVGGGGACGNSGGPGGGGGGGVVMMPVYVPSTGGTNQTITITVGGGVLGRTPLTYAGNTTVIFNAVGSYAAIPNTLIAGGGESGTVTGPVVPNPLGGSTGGIYGSTIIVPGNNTNYNYANACGAVSNNASGGGGAGTAGSGMNGGNGIQCFLPGIKDFSPSGIPYSYYYWGGGGGGYPYTTVVGGNNGGFGGAGSGLNATIQFSPYGINNPTNSGRDAGANTGSGGGGDSTNGSGGSGIVIIAFPKSIIVTNSISSLPTVLYQSGKYRDVLSNDSFYNTKTTLLSNAAYNSIKAAFSCKLVNYNYFGPTMILRHSADTTGSYTKNFYSDVFGNMGTGYMGTGQSVSSWLTAAGANTMYAFVVKWYNQGMDVSFNCATQYTIGSQPIYDVSNGLINLGYTGAGGGVASINAGAFMNLPDGALPYKDDSYSYTYKYKNIDNVSTGINAIIVAGGTAANSTMLAISVNGSLWYNNDSTVLYSYNSDSVITNAYQTGGNNRYYWKNGVSIKDTNTGTRAQTNLYNYINNSNNAGWSKANLQLYYMYVFNSSLTPLVNDRTLVEATPSSYSSPTSITITLVNVTATIFALTTTVVSGADYFVVYVNSTATYTSAKGLTSLSNVSITPITSGPWYINVYAYNSTNDLLSSGLIRYFSGQVLPLASGQSYPPVLTSNTFSISNINNIESFANGTYICNSSSYSTGMLVCNLFDPSGTGTQWQAYYTGAGTNPAGITYTQDPYNGAYRGGGSGASTFSTAINSVGTIGGDWFQVNTPFSFVLTSYFIGTGGRTMAEYYLVGSSDGSTWYKLDFVTGRTTSSPLNYTISPTPTVAYNYYRIIVTVSMFGAGSGEVANLSSWYLYGNVIY